MFSSEDTIVAIATPPGRGGIGVVRLSGPSAEAIARELLTNSAPLEPRRAIFTKLRVPDVFDHVVATAFPSPASYTGEDVVELSAHGSPVVLRAIVAAAVARGARLAEPGEFTLRAFLHGRIDLTQAEAVADLIDAVTPLQARTAFDQLDGTLTRAIGEIDSELFDLIARLEASIDFPDEGYHFVEPGDVVRHVEHVRARIVALLADAHRGRLVREGLRVAIVGRPNVGKSSVFNALVGAARAIVTDVPGTTRDLVTELIDLDGVPVTLVDTAGLRESSDLVEVEGIARSRQALAAADLIIEVVDEDEPQVVDSKVITVQNKIDLGRPGRGIRVSALTGAGLDDLRAAILTAFEIGSEADRPEITNVRHEALLERAASALGRAATAATGAVRGRGQHAASAVAVGALSEEFVLADLQDARTALEEVTGRRTADEVLARIFERFCIGK